MIGGLKQSDNIKEAIFWVLNFSDGKHSLLDIALKSKMNFKDIKKAADALQKADLLTLKNKEEGE